MNNLTKVTDTDRISSAIANIADKLLNRILPEEKAAATQIPIFCAKPIFCGRCVNGFKLCRCCRLPFRPPCYFVRIAC